MILQDQTHEMMTVAIADEAQRETIYQMRHDVYAEELSQHAVNERGRLSDSLDTFNTYLTVTSGGEMLGFVSVTPPGATPFSIDKYVDRERLPFELDRGVFEVRLLTVMPRHRHTQAAAVLMWAALRWVESRGGRRIVAIGRDAVMEMYERVGFERVGITVKSGAVGFEVMSASVQRLRRGGGRFVTRWEREGCIDWRLDTPFDRPAACYHGGAFFDAIGADFDTLERRDRVVNADVLDAWFDPSPGVVEALRDHLPWLLRTSPPTGCEGMVRAIATARGVDPACVLPGAGSSDLIFLALRRWLTPDSRVLILDPMYGEYAHVLEHVIGCEVDRLTLRRGDQYDVDTAALATRLAGGRYDLAILVNPNSPTGRHVDGHVLRDVLDQASPRTRVWIDETYIDYVGAAQSLERYAADSANVVICKSMSKVYALSGVRAAYMVGPMHLIESLRPPTPPWAVSLPGQLAAVRALQDPDYYAARYAETHRMRDAMARELATRFDIDVVPGVANFLLCHLPQPGPNAAELVRACRTSGVFLRDASNMGDHLGDRAIRIALKDEATNATIIGAIADVLR
ncbi:MAG: aminotransferase class I/II-fold pyridoxal phosphate-dependent enzyme [Phycisphaera sp.]|nr:aminotransferase class I/II-fold pyridoxal phosphate-dependent enzyme [Phycisphaera sp.]